MPKKYTIGQLSSITDLSPKAIRIYEEKGLITSTRDEDNNYRYFDESVKLQLQRIQTLKYLGFSLEEIKKMLVHFNQINLEDSFLEQKKMLEKKAFEINRLIHCMDKAAVECREREFELDEVFKMLNLIIINRKADEGVGFLRNHAVTKEPEGWSRWIFEQVTIKQGMQIMDAGAGYGNLWRYNQERIPADCKITCVDKHNTHADTFFEEYQGNEVFSFRWNDLENMTFGETYDLIFFNHVMHFIEKKEELLKLFQEALNENGKFVCTWGGTLLFDEIAKLLIEFKPDQKKKIEEGLQKRKEPILEYEKTLRAVFPYVEQRIRRVTLFYDNLEEFAGYLAENSKLGFDFSKYQDDFKEFIKEKFPQGNFHIERDGYLFICGDRA